MPLLILRSFPSVLFILLKLGSFGFSAMAILELVSYAALFFLSALLLQTIFSFTTRLWLHLPPSPFTLPIIGHLHLLGSLIHHSFHKLSLRYGPMIYLRLGSIPCVVISTPELAKELLKANELTFAYRHQTLAIDHLTYNSSLSFVPYGPYWKFIRRLCTWELLGNRNLNHFMPIRAEEYNRFLRVMYKNSEAGQSVNVTQELLKLTNNIISQMMLSTRYSETEGQAEEARTLVREVTQIFGEFNVSDFLWFCKNYDLQGFRKKFEDIHRRYDSMLEKIMAEREEARKLKEEKEGSKRNDDGMKDFLDLLFDVLEDDNSEIKVTRDQIKALVLDFFTAATDTSAIVVEWALTELINHPTILQKARDEIDQVVGKGRLVEELDGPNLPYIQAILKETFRLHPPVPMVTRKSYQESKVGGYTIPANSMVFVNVWSIGRNPNYWENPLEFRPERFLPSGEGDSTGLIDVRGQHFQLLPFGTGRRGCPGMSLAMQELPTVLAAMIQCFEWKVVNTPGEKANGDSVLDMGERPGLTAPRVHDLECVPIARFSPLNNLIP